MIRSLTEKEKSKFLKKLKDLEDQRRKDSFSRRSIDSRIRVDVSLIAYRSLVTSGKTLVEIEFRDKVMKEYENSGDIRVVERVLDEVCVSLPTGDYL